MKDAEAITRSAQVAKDHQASVVVVSATYGTTNQLIEMASLSSGGSWRKTEEILEALKARHRLIADDLNAGTEFTETIELLLEELETLVRGIFLLKDAPPKAMDRLLSIGERLSSPLMTVALSKIQKKKTENLDVRTVLRTDNQFSKAAPNISAIKNLCQKNLLGAKYGEVTYVTQGFIGATFEGETTTLGRGGSDYSAALLAEGLGADLLQIWTDVAGIATTDPRIVANARPINEITFKEAAELAVFGAKILHPTTLAPASRAGVSVFVGSSYQPDAPGTWIKKESANQPLVRAMAIKKDQALLTISTPKMANTFGFLARIFSVFDQHKISVDAITTSEISVAMTIEKVDLDRKEFFKDLGDLGEVKIEEGLSLVSLIGNNINHTPGLAMKIFNGLNGAPQDADKLINVRMICLGASRHNFCIAVDENDAPLAIQRLHKALIEGDQSE